MKARDKALGLIEMFRMDNTSDGESRAIKCAIFCVDEILITLPLILDIRDYWNEVKNEIKKFE
jgi:hypothetical protein